MTQNKKIVEMYMDGSRRTDRSLILSTLADDVEWEIPVRTQRTDGTILELAFCDVFEMQVGKIRRLISYLVETR